MSLRNLKLTSARRNPQLKLTLPAHAPHLHLTAMEGGNAGNAGAVFLPCRRWPKSLKGCNNAEVRFRPRPQGPSEQPHLRVGSPCKVVNITAGSRLDLRPLCRPEILNTQSEAPKDYSQLTASEQGSRLCYTRLISCVEIL